MKGERIIAVAVGFLCIFVSLLATMLVCQNAFKLSGEPLQLPLTQALWWSGLLAGLLMARILRRIAFKESLAVLGLTAFLPLLFSQTFADLFTFGTAAVYYGAVLLSAALILLLSLWLGGALGYLFCGDGKLSLSFSYERFLGRRFLMAKRGSRAVSIITLISVFAVTMGSCGMVVVMSVMDGFSSDLRQKIIGANAHLILLKYGEDFSEYQSVIEKTRQLRGITGASPFVYNEVMVSSEDNLSGAVIKGIQPETVGQVSLLPKNMVEGDLFALDHPESIPKPAKKDDLDSPASAPTLPGIIIGRELSRNLRVFIGDVISVVSPIGELGPTGPVPKAKAFRVAGIFVTGMYEYDSKFVYVALKEAQQFFTMKKSVSGIEYQVDDIDHIQAVSHELKQLLGGFPYNTKDFMQMNRNLFSALKLEKIAMFIILTALICMASLLILVALIMVVIEKGKEIAILKSMGATDSSIMKVFVTYGLTIGSVGAALGLLFGVGTCALIKIFGIGLDPEVYYITALPVRIDPLQVALVGIAAVLVSFLATVPPSLYAARLRPVEGLRYE